MARKKRVLWVGEASWTHSGFAVISRNVLRGLHATGRYELAELAVFGSARDPRAAGLPWRVYGNNPDTPDEEREYRSVLSNQWGEWRFDHAALDWRADVVLDARDYWNFEFIPRSPLRRFFRLGLMPAWDSSPVQDQWVDTIRSADALLSYSDWAAGEMRSALGPTPPIVGTAPAGVDHAVYRTLPKPDCRSSLGISPDWLVTLMVARNQARKLHPDLLDAFAALRSLVPAEVRPRLKLHLHTAWPDVGWDLPRLMRDSGTGDAVLFTYACRDCGLVRVLHWCGAHHVCPRCGGPRMMNPTPDAAVGDEALAVIYNAADAYVQYAVCVAGGTDVLTRRGWVPIEKLTVSDEAWTHRGRWRPVVRAMANGVKKTVTVRVKGDCESVNCTPDHKFLAISRSNGVGRPSSSLREYVGDLRRRGKPIPEPRFVEASRLVEGDLLAMPIDRTEVAAEPIDLAAYAKSGDEVGDEFINVRSGGRHPRFFHLTPANCRLMGLFAADGTTRSQKSVSFTLGLNKEGNRWLIDTLQPFSKMTVRRRSHATSRQYDYRVHNSLLVRFFTEQFYTADWHKCIPGWVLTLPMPLQKEFMQGMVGGDGYYRADMNMTTYSTTSPPLASGFKTLLRRHGLAHSVQLVDPNRYRSDSNRKPLHTFHVSGKLMSWEFPEPKNSTSFYHGDFFYLSVKSVVGADNPEPVYDIEVSEDHSYVTRVGCVHNCGAQELPIVEAAACGLKSFVVDYSAMEDFKHSVRAEPVPVQRFFWDAPTHSRRALPDNRRCAEMLARWLLVPETARAAEGARVAAACRDRYTWERAVSRWADLIDSLPPAEPWDSPPRPHRPAVPSDRLDPYAFVTEGLIHTAGRHDLVGTYLHLRMARDLDRGARVPHTGVHNFTEATGVDAHHTFVPYTREDCVRDLLGMCEQANLWEQRRAEAVRR